MLGIDLNIMRRLSQAGYDLYKLAPEMELKKEELSATKNGIIISWSIPVF